ncbi:MaoC like domain-containing protein [Xylanibacter ruminicola]|jgi:acyl dehydratase|uniref:MaoC like domain-containing protein n=1 Tax=Xylanibacter ruminicola TaxID=839 RepID=A0A1H5VXR5_XYLRU|nr:MULTISPECIES: MaoC/PaaZ C-terminal domain-containing protein [Prevotellaceae]MCR5469340.1 MaoC family dehydratase N-terminal domain-containing protein [Prevotella sp.]SEF91798.1 MaoC like domain-containing protein [Xylanibacter ruminicola]SEV81415.1 MaoC like domain-containing protein [Prevotella sp. khp7]
MTITELAEQTAHIEQVYQVTQEVYDSFQRCSRDMNPLHTDETFAREKGFKGCVMYGNILNAFISHFVGMCLPTPHVMIQSQDISFHKPVFLNDQITLQASIDTVSEAVNIINYKLKFYKMDEAGKQLVAKGHVQIGLLAH